MQSILICILLGTLFSTFVLGVEFGSICKNHSTCGEMMYCNEFNFCTCRPQYNSFQYLMSAGALYKATCEEPQKCVGRSIYSISDQIPWWCMETCDTEKDLCLCDGYIATESLDSLSKGRGTTWGDIGASCKKPTALLGGWCSTYTICEIGRGLRCNGKCICADDLMYDFSLERCVPKAPYMKENNLTEYKVRFGHYCSSQEDCLPGLECAKNFSCVCSIPCEHYNHERDSCDCGYDYPGTPIGPIITGIILGLASVMFWCCSIAIACPEEKEENTDGDEEEEHPMTNNPPSTNNEASAPLPTAPPIPLSSGCDAPPPYAVVVGDTNQDRENQYHKIPQNDLDSRPDIQKPNINSLQDINPFTPRKDDFGIGFGGNLEPDFSQRRHSYAPSGDRSPQARARLNSYTHRGEDFGIGFGGNQDDTDLSKRKDSNAQQPSSNTQAPNSSPSYAPKQEDFGIGYGSPGYNSNIDAGAPKDGTGTTSSIARDNDRSYFFS